MSFKLTESVKIQTWNRFFFSVLAGSILARKVTFFKIEIGKIIYDLTTLVVTNPRGAAVQLIPIVR